MTLVELNNLPAERAFVEFQKCCGAKNWARRVIEQRPFRDKTELFVTAEQLWKKLPREDWLEAFLCHPKIGDVKSLEEKFANNERWASSEQSGIKNASEKISEDLAEGNHQYEKKFGYIFIICATGKSAEEILGLLLDRLNNDPEKELLIAADEQNKITKIRLEKLLSTT